MSRQIAGLMVILGLAACGRPATPAVGKWEIFDAYPGARELCTQRVYMAGAGQMHFTWWAYVSADPPERAIAFYEARHRRLKAVDVKEWFSLRGPEGQTLSVHDAAAGGYPTCDRKPGAEDRAVIIVSSASPTAARPGPSLRFSDSPHGCGDAYVVAESVDGSEVLLVGLERQPLGLTTEPKTFQIEDRPAGLDVSVLVYPSRPSYSTHCTDLIAPSDELPPVPWIGVRGRITAAISIAKPKQGECYRVDVRLEDVAFAAAGQKVVLEHLDLKGISVGRKAPLGCPP